MQDEIWETFDAAFKQLAKQGKRIDELEARIIELEKRLSEQSNVISFPVKEDVAKSA